MSQDQLNEPEETQSPRDMQLWAQQQIKDASKALELRIREATALSAAYLAGEISPAQAEERQALYYHRWGEALPGVSVTEGMTDQQIMAGVDTAATVSDGPFIAPSATHARGVVRSRVPSQSTLDRS